MDVHLCIKELQNLPERMVIALHQKNDKIGGIPLLKEHFILDKKILDAKIQQPIQDGQQSCTTYKLLLDITKSHVISKPHHLRITRSSNVGPVPLAYSPQFHIVRVGAQLLPKKVDESLLFVDQLQVGTSRESKGVKCADIRVQLMKSTKYK